MTTASPSEDLQLAIHMAFMAHVNQVDKNGIPYIVHPLNVMSYCMREWPDDEVTHIAAVLHDVVEDTYWTQEMVRNLFGAAVGDIVYLLTRNDRQSHSQYLKAIKGLQGACKVKWADAKDNARVDRMIDENKTKWYAKIQEEMWESIHHD